MPRLSSVSSKNLSGIVDTAKKFPAVFSNYRIDNPITTDPLSFGSKIAISKNYLIAGVPSTTIATNTNAGIAYIFDVSTGQLVHTLQNPNAFGTPVGDAFGSSVAISDNYAVVTANAEDETGNLNSGKAYVYNVTTGQLLHTLNNPNAFGTPANDLFGDSCAMSGTLIAITARGEDDASGSDSGKVYIFDAVTGQLQRTLDNPNVAGTSANDQFGSFNLAMSGNFLAVPAVREDIPADSNNNTGIVYIFNAVTGERIYNLANPGTAGPTDDLFGHVAISNRYVAVGVAGEDDTGTNSGIVYIFSMATGELVRTIQNPNAFGTPDEDSFGSSVGITDKFVVVAASGEDSTGNLSGIVYVFNIASGDLLYTLIPPVLHGPTGAQFFSQLAISGNNIVVGAPNESSPGFGASSGKIHVYNSKITVPFYPMANIPREMEIVKLDWNDGIVNTADRSTFTRAMTNEGSEHSVVSIQGPYGTTDNIYRNPSGNSRIIMQSLAGATSDQYFTGTNSWSIEWWGNYNWDGDNLDSNVIWGNGTGGDLRLFGRTDSATGFQLSLGFSLSNTNTGTSEPFTNIPYTNNTWAHWVVAWQAITATSGQFHIWINGVRCVNQTVNKPTDMDFFRNAFGTAFAFSPFNNQALPGDVVDYRILNNAAVWTDLGDRFTLPKKSFNV
jgi:hypothetical protein